MQKPALTLFVPYITDDGKAEWVKLPFPPRKVAKKKYWSSCSRGSRYHLSRRQIIIVKRPKTAAEAILSKLHADIGIHADREIQLVIRAG